MSKFFLQSEHLQEAQQLLDSGLSCEVQFSGGTYQAEIEDAKNKTTYWPFLQINDQGVVLDSFCSCSSEKESCVHLASAYLQIFNHTQQPLHVRFRSSFWNQLCQIACRRHGWDTSAVHSLVSGDYEARSVTGKKLFYIEGLDVDSQQKLKSLLFERAIETEETSLKFSNLSPEELKAWKSGHPSLDLQYELCFWSDLAKWLMNLQELKKDYRIEFEAKPDQLPQWVHIQFASIKVGFYIASANWPFLIPSLDSVQSSLSVYEFQNYVLKAIRYEEKRRCLLIEKEPVNSGLKVQMSEQKTITVADWLYVSAVGFFPKELDQVFDADEITFEKIGRVLSQYAPILQKYLVGVKLHLQGLVAQYKIHFDEQENLHIVCYAFEPGDLQAEGSVYFGPWIYLKDKGFYLLQQHLFKGVEQIILRSQMNHFINHHRAWLGGFEGFQTHVYRLESNLHFRVSKQGVLQFFALVEMLDQSEGMIDFGEWIYFPEKGFFAKKVGKGAGLISPNAIVPKEQVASFIRLHKEELETVPGFFTSRSPLEKSGLDLFLNEKGSIVVRPHFQWLPTCKEISIQIFEEYTYVEGSGFCEIPYECRVPEAYLHEKTIAQADEAYFILYEIETLKSYITSLQNELQKPKRLSLNVLSIEKNLRSQGVEWLLEADFETEIGSVDLFSVWEALQENRHYFFSSAGCLLLKLPRFNWLKTVTKKQWLKKGKQLRLTTLQWLRLNAFEALKASQDTADPLFLMQQLSSFETDHPFDLTGFKSSLRTYQETGVHWLWFLFTHGLSGLLCDEMGLGKTHQAMGLIAALKNHSQEDGFPDQILVVCPTSVIYHWEALLQKFLPEKRVIVFYGQARSLDQIEQKGTILLTSYGTLRGDIAALSQIEFQLAIFDELQIAKNNRSQTHKALKKIAAQMRLGLSGTPLENRLLELKALFDVVIPGYLPQEAQFKELFVTPIEKHQDNEKKQLLLRLIKPFILRRKKSEVLLELPEKIEEISYCDLSDEQRDLYQKTCLLHKDALIRELENQHKPVPYLHVFSLLSSLKQICDHPCLISKQYAQFQKHRSGKWDLFVELLQEIRDSGQKVVIFSQYLDMLDLIQVYLNEHQIGYAGIRGSTRDRKEQLERFRDDPKCEVFLASLQAVGVGVDLVSASVVIHYDRWWNPAREDQATDRVHRIGQNRGVQVFKMVTKGTIEEHIHELIERKKNLIKGVIGFDEQDQIKGFNRDELLSLLRQIGHED